MDHIASITAFAALLIGMATFIHVMVRQNGREIVMALRGEWTPRQIAPVRVTRPARTGRQQRAVA